MSNYTLAKGEIYLGRLMWHRKNDRYFGDLDEFRVYTRRALSPTEVAANYDTQVTSDVMLALSLTFDDPADLAKDYSCSKAGSGPNDYSAATVDGKECGSAVEADSCPCFGILAPTNGAMTCTKGHQAHGSVCTITCDPNFVFQEGVSTRTCDSESSSTFSGNAVSCTDCQQSAVSLDNNPSSTCSSGSDCKSVTTAPVDSISGNSFTVQLWVRRKDSGIGTKEHLLSQGEGSLRGAVQLLFLADNTFSFSLFDDLTITSSAFASDADLWIHWTTTLDHNSNAMTTYRNGRLEALQAASGTRNAGNAGGTTSASGGFYIGGNVWEPQDSPFNGEVDEFRVWAGRSLLNSDIEENYVQQITVSIFLVLSLTFDEPTNVGRDFSCGGMSDATSVNADVTVGRLCGVQSAALQPCVGSCVMPSAIPSRRGVMECTNSSLDGSICTTNCANGFYLSSGSRNRTCRTIVDITFGGTPAVCSICDRQKWLNAERTVCSDYADWPVLLAEGGANSGKIILQGGAMSLDLTSVTNDENSFGWSSEFLESSVQIFVGWRPVKATLRVTDTEVVALLSKEHVDFLVGTSQGNSSVLIMRRGSAGQSFNTTIVIRVEKICDVGLRQDPDDPSKCKACREGTFAPESGSKDCRYVDRGHKIVLEDGLRVDQTTCDAGTFNDQQGRELCSPCPERSSCVTRSNTPVKCAQYEFSPEGDSFCHTPGPGNYSMGQAHQVMCEPGYTCSGGMRTVCPKGQHSVSDRSSCVACPRGEYNDQEGRETCSPCPVSTFQDEEGGSLCSLCMPGKTSSESGDGCVCDSTKGMLTGRSGSCICKPGAFAAGEKRTCTPCPENNFWEMDEDEGTVSCKLCPEQLKSPEGSASPASCNCGKGSFNLNWLKVDSESNRTCKECLLGGICPGLLHNGSIFTKPGFWRSSRSSLNFYRCPNTESCLGSPACTLDAVSLDFDCKAEAASNLSYPASECRDGYEGRLCFGCKPGWGSNKGTCIPCPPGSGNSSILRYILVSGVMFLGYLLVLLSLHSLASENPGGKIGRPLNLFIEHMQTLSCLSSFTVLWSTQTQWILSTASVGDFGLDLLQVTCASRMDFLDSLTATVAYVFALTLALFFAIYIKHKCCLKKEHKKAQKRTAKRSRDLYLALLIVVLQGQVSNWPSNSPSSFIFIDFVAVTGIFFVISFLSSQSSFFFFLLSRLF